MNHASHMIELINEPTHSFGSADNVRTYDTEVLIDSDHAPSSIHGVIIDGHPIIVVGASGGATGIHSHSLIHLGEIICFAVGPYVCRMTLGKKALDWYAEVDNVTCFGIHYSEQHDALISHGELSIARLTREGKVLWSAGGADIFTEGFSLLPDWIEVIDFYQRVFHFDYDTGESTRHNKHMESMRSTRLESE